MPIDLEKIKFDGSSPNLRVTSGQLARCGRPVRSLPARAGTLSRPRQGSRLVRFIPAPAGNTCTTAASSGSRSVHPRACGGHGVEAVVDQTTGGSAPRLRGTLVGGKASIRDGRFIPAPAGATPSSARPEAATTVHPRICGGHLCWSGITVNVNGSSPRLQGTRHLGHQQSGRGRCIPAPAGNTSVDQ